MNLMHTREWISFEEMNLLLCDKEDKEIKSWLLEEGPITERIKSNGDFELELVKDKVDFVRDDEKSFLGNIGGKIKVREVFLRENNKLKVWARSCIPLETIKYLFANQVLVIENTLIEILLQHLLSDCLQVSHNLAYLITLEFYYCPNSIQFESG